MTQHTLRELLQVRSDVLGFAKSEGIEGIEKRFFEAVNNFQIAYYQHYHNGTLQLVTASLAYGVEKASEFLQKSIIYAGEAKVADDYHKSIKIPLSFEEDDREVPDVPIIIKSEYMKYFIKCEKNV